ncbi:glycosyltransferase [bacterium]|nr:glycosyltransferase [bacterium]
MISVILPVFNRVETISCSIFHLLECVEVSEILIADGGSIDGTVEAIEAITDERIQIVSRTDRGIYEGANKAIAIASGQFLWFMNSDDFGSPDYAAAAAQTLMNEPGTDFVFGNITYGSKLVRPRLLTREHSVWQYMPFPHVSLIIRRSTHQRCLGGYDEARAIGGDLDYVNRLLKSGLKGSFINLPAAQCAPGGISTSCRQIWEARSIAIQQGKPKLKATFFALAVFFRRVWVARFDK